MNCGSVLSITIPATWVKFTQDNLARAQQERENSVKLRGDMDGLMRACANEMWTHFNSVNNALGSRVNETKDAKTKLHAHLQRVRIIIINAAKSHLIEQLFCSYRVYISGSVASYSRAVWSELSACVLAE